jgi:hypothetical protein
MPGKTFIVTVAAAAALGCSGSHAVKTPAEPAVTGEARDFHFEYQATVTGIPAGAKSVRIWVPLPASDAAQTISNLKITSPVSHQETHEAVYGNRVAYFAATGTPPGTIPISIAFDARRFEVKSMKGLAGSRLKARALEPDKLAPLGGEVAARADAATAGKATVAEKARGLYDRTLADVTYDKSGQGWGRGDVQYVCSVGKGNCSDFHALFIGMARAEKIPALFEIGFPLPPGKKEGEIGGYHCWAWYEDVDGAWKPIDASEADKDPAKTDYFFGTLCANRVGLSRGRDIVLEPPQAGEPLNFFIYPYVEVDGKPDVAKVERKFTFQDLPAAGKAVASSP